MGCWLVSLTQRGDQTSSASSAIVLTACRELRLLEAFVWMTWRYKASAFDEGANGAEPIAASPVDRASVGTLTWEVVFGVYLSERIALPENIDLHDPLTPRRLEQDYGHRYLEGNEETVAEFLQMERDPFKYVLVVSAEDADNIMDHSLPYTLRVLPVTPRADRSLFYCGLPPAASVARWRKDARAVRTPPQPSLGIEGQSKGVCEMLTLPVTQPRMKATSDPAGQESEAKPDKMDPLRLLNAISFGTWLRGVDDFDDALEDGRMYEENDFIGEHRRSKANDPSTSSIFRAQRRCDIVGMLIERRLWAEEVADDLVQSITCYSDSSPAVGTELQGMVADVIRKDHTMRRVWLPGGPSSMASRMRSRRSCATCGRLGSSSDRV